MATGKNVVTSETRTLESQNSKYRLAWPRCGWKVERWVNAARFLPAWLLPASLGLELKWYMMTSLSGFARVGRSIGAHSLTLAEKLSLFRGDVVVGFLLIPTVLWIINRVLKPRLSGIFTALVSGCALLLLAVQLRALDEVGQYISFKMMWIAFGWGLHEPGANAGYLSAKSVFTALGGLLAIGVLTVWASKTARPSYSDRAIRNVRIGGEAYVLVLAVIVAAGWKTPLPMTPYHESGMVRAAVSLWTEGAVDTGEFAAFDFDRRMRPHAGFPPSIPEPELIGRYQELASAPHIETDPRYFGREAGDNVLFFILETTPDEFLLADDDLKQFPSLARLRAKSFVGARHYTTLPITSAALFSVFSSWYPLDTVSGAWGFDGGKYASDFLPRLAAEGYETAAFSPLRYVAEQDDAMYRAVGFHDWYVPDDGLKGYEGNSSWKTERVAADVATLHLLESKLDQWIGSHRRFVAAFLPQIGHFPYPDSYPPDSTENLRERGRAIIGVEDAWLGELEDFLQKRGQLDKTMIVILGDHGRRSRRENPELRRGTIDETAFHVPLLIYAPRTLDQTENIDWVTSHIDVVPTLMDLLGERGGRESEQGSPIWDPNLANRTTFLMAQAMFGADGYTSQGKFYMWNYFSDSVYENSRAVFELPDFIPRTSAIARTVTSNIATMDALEAAWHRRFAQPIPPSY